MIELSWTGRAQDDLAAIHAFVQVDSPHFAGVIIRRLITSVEALRDFPSLGRIVPEYSNPEVREIVLPPYRIVYRILSGTEIHVLTVHHAARGAVSIG